MKAKRLKALRSKLLRKDPAKLADIIERDLAKPSPHIGAGSPKTLVKSTVSGRAKRQRPVNATLLRPKQETGNTIGIHRKTSPSLPREMKGEITSGKYKKPAGKLLHDRSENGVTINTPTRKVHRKTKKVRSDKRPSGVLGDSQGTGMYFKKRKAHKSSPKIQKPKTIRVLAIKFHKKAKKARLDAEDRRDMRAGTYNAREEAAENKPIHVKKGALHTELGIPQGQKIPMGTLEKAKHSKNALLRKRANFAINFGHPQHKATPSYKRVVDNKMKYFGETDHQKKTIRINKKKSLKSGKGELLDTIAHEEMHAKHPNMKEKTVRRKTAGVVKKMSRKQKSKMYGKYC